MEEISNIRVTIAEDHMVSRAQLENLMKNNGFDVVLSSAGSDELIGSLLTLEEPPDIHILNIDMPVHEVTSIARKLVNWPDVKILVMSVNTPPEDNARTKYKKNLKRGYIVIGNTAEELYRAVTAMHYGGFQINSLGGKEHVDYLSKIKKSEPAP